MKRITGFRTILLALGLSMVAVVVLWLGTAFNIWASSGLVNISLLLLFVIPLSLILFVFLVHREQERTKDKQQENGSSRTS
jgi:membrane protein implicated in regulation of membrane protease activity